MNTCQPTITYVPGVYAITCTETGKSYIGSTVALSGRRHVHFKALLRGKHYNFDLQSDFNKYGLSAFRFKVLVYCSPVELSTIEERTARTIGVDNLYNKHASFGRSLHRYYIYMQEITDKFVSEKENGKWEQ